jgi:hypothetical protein
VNCARALAILAGLKVRQVEAEPDEMDELIAAKLVIEVAPHALALLQEIHKLAEAHPSELAGFPSAPAVQAVHDAVDRDLKNDWFRLSHSNAKLLAMAEERASLRRVLGGLADPDTATHLQDALNKRLLLAKGAGYTPCPSVGSGLFGLTERGVLVLGHLGARKERFGEAKLKTFLAQLDKQDAKLRAFSEQIDVISQHVGAVRKNRGQVLVGLVKTELPASEATALYLRATTRGQPPDVAVTCARHATREGGTSKVQKKLGAAYDALIRAGYPDSPALQGAVKSLLPWSPPEAGLSRFAALCRALHDQGNARGDELYKFTARLMMADGAPHELVQRALHAAHRLSQGPALVPRAYRLGPAAVALAAMVPDDASVDGACDRFLALELALAQGGLADRLTAESRALDCLPCPGAPTEVVATVHAVMGRLSPSLPAAERLTVATAFAKRFAF